MRFLWNLEGDFLSQLYMSNYPFRAGVSLFSLLHASLCSFARPPPPPPKKKVFPPPLLTQCIFQLTTWSYYLDSYRFFCNFKPVTVFIT